MGTHGIFKDYLATFDNHNGERVLAHLEKMFGVRDTIEPEELINKALEGNNQLERIPLDPMALAKRQGLKSAYWKIVAVLEAAREVVVDES